ncbi:MAG: WYL domain-containing protein [Spirochaetota bacterium]
MSVQAGTEAAGRAGRLVLASIASGEPVVFRYRGRYDDKPRERKVRFSCTYERYGHAYAVGYCFTRGALRTFRLDRFTGVLQPAGAPASPATVEAGFSPTVKDSFKPGVYILLALASITVAVAAALAGSMPLALGWRYTSTQGGVVAGDSLRYSYAVSTGTEPTGEEEPQRLTENGEGAPGHGEEGAGSAGEQAGVGRSTPDHGPAGLRMETEGRTPADLYDRADLDGDGALCWTEIRAFQNRVVYTFEYQENRTALFPEEFLRNGGGDCEDFALFTAGLLAHWGYTAYLGLIHRADRYHAVALAWLESLPPSHRGLYVHRARTAAGRVLEDGYLTCIDFTRVGELPRMGLFVAEPEWCHGRPM